MALTAIEKCAGRSFRGACEEQLAAVLLEWPDSAPCSAQAEYFRHECSREGRTRSLHLADVTLLSPEIWVTWGDGDLRVISKGEADQLVADGIAVEVEQVLAGKFSFTWKRGNCVPCGLKVLSREGVFRDARPLPGARQDDLASFAQGPLLRTTRGLKREHDL